MVIECTKKQTTGEEVIVECKLEWGITDLEPNNKRKKDTRHLYITAQTDCRCYTENWQPQVNQLMRKFQRFLWPLIIAQPTKDVLNLRRNVTNQLINKVSLNDAFEDAKYRLEVEWMKTKVAAAITSTQAKSATIVDS